MVLDACIGEEHLRCIHLSHIQKFWVELGSTPIHGDVDLFNVDLFGRAMLSDHAMHDHHLLVELGSTPMKKSLCIIGQGSCLFG